MTIDIEEVARCDVLYARAAMDLREARRKRDALAVKIVERLIEGRATDALCHTFTRVQNRVDLAEDRLERAAEDCDVARGI